MSLDLVLKARKPTRVMLRPWAAMQDAAANNPHGIDYDGCFFEPFTRTSILEPDIDPANWTYGKEGYYLLPSQAQWVEGEGAFGDGGGYVAFAGDLSYDQTTPWEAYWSNSLPAGANWPVQFNLHWFPPPNSFIPQIQVWPRVDFTLWATIGGAVYFFAPLGFSVDLSSNMLTVYEYEYDSLNAFAADPTKMLQKTYQHPMVLGPMGISNAWILLQVIPIPYSYTSEDEDPPNNVYTYHDFILRSPHLKNGGFAYYTKIPRKLLSLFPQGWPGMRSMTGGGAALSIIPIKQPSTGYFISKEYSKREANTDYPSVDDVSWVPTGGSVTHQVVHPDTLVEIVGGETFQDFKIKTTLTPGTGQYETPVVYWVKPDKAGAAEDRAQDETDISDYVRIRESMSEDLIGYKAGVLLFNRDGEYNELVYQPMNELSFHICGEDRAVLYTLDPKFQWWQTQDHEALTIDWATGDFWERMKTMYVSGMPDYGGQALNAAITNYLTRLGFDPALISIDATLDYILPRSRSTNDPIAKPEDGSTADQFLADLQEKWFSDWPMYFDAVDSGGILKPRFNIDAPLDALDYSNVKRVYYLNREDAAAALADDQQAYADGDLDTDPDTEDYTYFCQQPEVVFLHQDHKNEIWVVGLDQATGQPIFDMWVDSPSQTDENYLYYVGERRLIYVLTRYNSLAYLSWMLDELRKAFGYLRRQISFTSKYDSALRAGDYIRFYNLAHVWKVISIDQDIAPGTVSFSNDDTVHGCRIEAVQWTTGWW